jgi:hypothetical protein
MLKIENETVATPPAFTQEPPTSHGLSRRRVLQLGGGLVIVFAGGMLFRAYDQGVFSTGEGAAYDAWREWNLQTGGVPLSLVRAAVLAASAHNSQPL